MKFFEIDEEYLKKGGLITRDKKSGLAFGVVNGCLVAFKNGIKIEPEVIFKGCVADDLLMIGNIYHMNKLKNGNLTTVIFIIILVLPVTLRVKGF